MSPSAGRTFGLHRPQAGQTGSVGNPRRVTEATSAIPRQHSTRTAPKGRSEVVHGPDRGRLVVETPEGQASVQVQVMSASIGSAQLPDPLSTRKFPASSEPLPSASTVMVAVL